MLPDNGEGDGRHDAPLVPLTDWLIYNGYLVTIKDAIECSRTTRPRRRRVISNLERRYRRGHDGAGAAFFAFRADHDPNDLAAAVAAVQRKEAVRVTADIQQGNGGRSAAAAGQ